MTTRSHLLVSGLLALGPAAPAMYADAVPTAERTTTPQARATATTSAAAVRVPGNLTGLGFDTCQAPDQTTMDTLRTTSPFWGVGVYIGGAERGCAQPELTATWVRTQAAKKWRIFPIWVARQSQCADRQDTEDPFTHLISRNNLQAKQQGREAASAAVRAASGLAMAKGSTLFLDVEAYDNTTSACNQPVMNYQSGWSQRLHALGWKAGFYSAALSGIKALDYVRATFPGTYVMPDAIWFAHDNGVATTDGDPWVRDSFWTTQRVHQYRIDVERTYGGVQQVIDMNAIRIGRGSVAPKAGHNCGGVRLDFSPYQSLSRGEVSPQVKAAQCLLRQRGLYDGRLVERYTPATAWAVRQFQDRRGLRVTGALNPSTWTALLSAGTQPLLKRGSAADRVRFLQRALRPALARKLEVTGVVNSVTEVAVKRYQRAVGHPVTGVVTRATWKALQDGLR
ncbi:MAG: glycoside hydrolase domain-containing protein [Nocardioidaceae bacterium]